MSDWEIREYASEDFEECREIIEKATSSIDTKYSSEELEHLEQAVPDMVAELAEKDEFKFYVAENETITGVAGFHPKGKIAGIFIHPDHQREGIGRKLMQKIDNEAEKEGVEELEVSASITAKEFYEKFGFKTIEETESEIEGKYIPIYKMKKKL
ncbi:MAG: GNAT family N-acetyltransferase [Candidatus Nanohalobium sp.]